MNCDDNPGVSRCNDEFLREQFPYLKRGENGEFIIPAQKIDDFVSKYQSLSDNDDHLERLRQYRAGGQRVKPSEFDD
ncbi:MAG: hypothetical protein FD177_1760 [Desulfovibrionaceae bacterium]|nr:MAG: hypothetical protein FD177_1760 [Desulfovibrionaceae bacterium]